MAEGREDPLAYGEYHERAGAGNGAGDLGEGERGFVGDTFRRFRDRYQGQPPAGPSNNPPNGGPEQSDGLGSSLFNKLHGAVHGLGSEIKQRLNDRPSSSQGQGASHPDYSQSSAGGTRNRYDSFAQRRNGNEVKWYVDGCGYMWAVSIAIMQARESIWILDWWLSPELYLRRPPSKNGNERYRIDHMLQAAAERGVKVNIIVYKEVTQALTRKYLSPTLPSYFQSLLHHRTDRYTRAMCGLGIAATFAGLEYIEAENPLIGPPITVSSSHTKHHLENLHKNICVFRHPDHLPDAQSLQSSFLSSLQNLSLSAKTASNLPGDALKAIYGMNDDVILYWAHHEKLCLVDGHVAFMGGLDLCYGRWDTNQHPIADCHPANVNDIVFPGQDWNNARIADFQDVAHWDAKNVLDRKTSSRMGWSDISISLRGPVVEDLKLHFVERWNFIYNEKYDVRKDSRYSRLSIAGSQPGVNPQSRPPAPQSEQPFQVYSQNQVSAGQTYPSSGQPYPPSDQPYPTSQQPYTPSQQPYTTSGQPYFPPPPTSSRGLGAGDTDDGTQRGFGSGSASEHHHHRFEEKAAEAREAAENMRDHFENRAQRMEERYLGGQRPGSSNGIPCQIVRSCSKWSHGVPTQHSIQNAYIDVIERSQHFIYIENQFFITATDDKQKPVRNKIGDAIVSRILGAARAGEKYKVIVIMPAVPAFAGDLKDDASLGTRAIMEFQYNSINRGGYSIMECIANAGFNPTEYIRFYNLRNYDRINAGASMRDIEQRSGVDYEDARKEHDNAVELPATSQDHGLNQGGNYQAYQQAASQHYDGQPSDRWDTVSECYMLGGRDIREVPWENGDLTEMDAFVSEELYVHSKVLIADDQIVICGSANLNDRSQLGDHDSEIAIVIEDPARLPSTMNGRPWQASRFAATLRRQLFRKHLGLIPAQDMTRPDANFEPVGMGGGNIYDFGSPEDRLVADPLADTFLAFWNSRARQNTYAFGKTFHPVPHDDVRTWADYDRFYEQYFKSAGKEAEGKEGKKPQPKYLWGHVVKDEFSPGEQGVREMKDLLATIKGTLVEMPLLFLIEEDIAKEGFGLNAFTEDVYT